MRATEPESLTLLATPNAAVLLGDRPELGLVHGASAGRPSPGTVVLLATPADNLDAVPSDAVVIAVVRERQVGVGAAPSDPRFADYVFSSASRTEITFRARLALSRTTGNGVRLLDDGLQCGEHRVPLSIIEQRLIEKLNERPGTVVSRGDLQRAMRESAPGVGSDSRALDAHMYRLRRKLRAIPCVEIETLRQRGFALTLHPPQG